MVGFRVLMLTRWAAWPTCAISAVLAAGWVWPALPQATEQESDAPQEVAQEAEAPDAVVDDVDEAGESPAEDEPAEDAPRRQGFAQQIGLVTEMANAYRLRDELNEILTSDGRASAAVGGAGDTKLAGLATRAEVLSNSASFDQARALLLDCQARANAALAQVQTNGFEQARLRRLRQLRTAADNIRTLDVPFAQPAADYWHLLADLADAAQANVTVAARQTLAEELLVGYVDQHAEASAGREYVVDVRLSLAQLMDERGDQRGVAQQIDAIGELPDNSPRLQEVDRLHASVQRIGRAVELEAVTTQLELWRLGDLTGQPVLLHVYADAVEPSVVMIDQIKRIIAARALGGFAIASLRVGDPIVGTTAPRWPTLPIALEPGGILDQIGIDALPALVWIDAKGQIASIGYTTAVLDQMPIAKPDPKDDAADPAKPAPTPADEADEAGTETPVDP